MSTPAKDVPRYIEIRRALAMRIMSGDWRPGYRVPSEHELMQQYGCSRMTVNKALSALATSGLIVRKRRSGSFVASPQSQNTTLEIHDIRSEVVSGGHAYRYAVQSRRLRKCTRQDMERLAVEAGDRVLAVTVVHFASDRPFVLEERLISLRTVPEAETEHFVIAPPGSWLLDRIPWTQAEHMITAVGAGENAAKLLNIGEGTACLVIERKTWQSGVPVTWVCLTYPGDRHRLVSRFAPTSRPRPGTEMKGTRSEFAA
jgi:GntR family histidine utilization transcriptional repressor